MPHTAAPTLFLFCPHGQTGFTNLESVHFEFQDALDFIGIQLEAVPVFRRNGLCCAVIVDLDLLLSVEMSFLDEISDFHDDAPFSIRYARSGSQPDCRFLR